MKPIRLKKRPGHRFFVRTLIFVLAFCLPEGFFPFFARATVADLLGLGSRAVAMGGAYTALADDFSSVFYNPAGLSSVKESNLTVGGIWAKPRFYYQEEGLPKTCPHLYATGGLYLGVATNLGHLTGYGQLERWTLGILLYLPVERALLADVPYQSSEKKFIFYLDQSQVLTFMMSLAWQVNDWLSLGAGANFLADLRAPNEAFVDVDIRTVVPYLAGVSDLEKKVRPRIMRDAEIKASPVIGIRLKPLSWLLLGATYRGKFYSETVGTQDIVLRFYDFSGRTPLSLQSAVLADIHYIHWWNPHQVSTGVAFLPSDSLRIALDATWADWSAYMDSMWYAPEQRFSDTFTPRIGVEYRLGCGIFLRGGYSFQPSPVPEQTRASNYLDNDKHVVSAGIGTTLSRLPWLPVWKKPLSVDAYFQFTQLVKRTYHKETGYGRTVELGGSMLNGGMSLTLHY